MNPRMLALIASLALAGCGALTQRDDVASDPTALLAQRENALGLSLAKAGRYGEAVSFFEAAIVLEPRAAYLHNNLGYAHLRRGALEQAVAELEEAMRLDPVHPQAVANLAEARAALTRQAHAHAAAAPAPMPPAAPHPEPMARKEEATSDLRLVELGPQIYELAAVVPPRPAPVPAAPAPAPVALAPADSAPAPTRQYHLEVANGNGVRGMARRVATSLVERGLVHARITNDKPFNKAETEVYYRPGYEAQAREVAAKLTGKARLIAGRPLPSGVDVRVVLGGDRRPVQYIL